MRRKSHLLVIFAIGLLAFYRFGFHVTLPGINQAAMAATAKKAAAAQTPAAHWEDVAPGISYGHMELPGPIKVFMARADRSKNTWTIDSMTSMGTIKGGTETVPDMVKRYDDTVTWDGKRYEIKAAINGDYFNVRDRNRLIGYAFGGQVLAGWYAKRYGDDGGLSGFFWTADRKCAIGGDVHNGPKLQHVLFADKTEMNINALNDNRGPDELALYTSHWDGTTGTDNRGVEVLVRMNEPLAINPKDPGNPGVILSVAKNTGSTPIPFDCVVLSATGTAAKQLLQHAKVGEPVHFRMRVEDVGVERIGLKPADWHNVWGSIGDTQNLVVNGVVTKQWEAKAAKLAAEGKPHGSVAHDPRTGIAFNKDYIYFIVVDGRTEESHGMTFTQLGEFCKNELNADFAVNQDGGGSSLLWIDGQIKNVPSDRKQDDKDAKGGKPGIPRRVANGYMMTLVHPPQFSKILKAGSKVTAKAELELKLGPGSQYGPAGKVASGTAGEILKHRLDGVFAKGENWWQVKFGDAEGWAPEASLVSGK